MLKEHRPGQSAGHNAPYQAPRSWLAWGKSSLKCQPLGVHCRITVISPRVEIHKAGHPIGMLAGQGGQLMAAAEWPTNTALSSLSVSTALCFQGAVVPDYSKRLIILEENNFSL